MVELLDMDYKNSYVYYVLNIKYKFKIFEGDRNYKICKMWFRRNGKYNEKKNWCV